MCDGTASISVSGGNALASYTTFWSNGNTGLNATSIVWIASEFEDEHRATLDWLNEHTEPEINFFGIKLEAVNIHGSPVAPNFRVVSQPNDWTKSRTNSILRRSIIDKIFKLHHI